MAKSARLSPPDLSRRVAMERVLLLCALLAGCAAAAGCSTTSDCQLNVRLPLPLPLLLALALLLAACAAASAAAAAALLPWLMPDCQGKKGLEAQRPLAFLAACC